jgi:nitrogen fixation NifU-like protein
MPVPSPYHQLVLDHSREPHRFGELDGHTHAADGSNPLCGDALRLELRVAGGRVVGYAFRGEACAVARAAASMLGDRLEGADVAALDRIESALHELVTGKRASDDALGELNAFAALAQYPSRRKCALLPVATARAALSGVSAATTQQTEDERSR